MEISVTAWEKHKPQGNGRDPVSAKSPLYKGSTVIQGSDLSLRGSLLGSLWGEERDRTSAVIEPSLEDEGGGGLIDDVTAGMAIGGIAASRLEDGVDLRSGEALVPEVDGQSRML
jgi:hypothetical protein